MLTGVARLMIGLNIGLRNTFMAIVSGMVIHLNADLSYVSTFLNTFLCGETNTRLRTY
jgi:hypothetical protein